MAEAWFRETLHAHWGQSFEVAAELHAAATGLQDLRIFDNPRFGRVLTLDGAVQVATGDEFIYHEMLAHVPLIAHGAATDALILGGGDGGILREVLRHPGVRRATLVEIDAAVIALSRAWLPEVSAGAFDDPRAEIVIADAARFVAETERRFDVVLVDSTDPVGPAEVLFGADFYAACARILRPGGVLAAQNGVPFLQPAELTGTWRRLGPLFADRWFYLLAAPTYAGGHMALAWASQDPSLRALPTTTLAARAAAAGLDACRYYTPEVHAAAFALPAFIRALMT